MTVTEGTLSLREPCGYTALMPVSPLSPGCLMSEFSQVCVGTILSF